MQHKIDNDLKVTYGLIEWERHVEQARREGWHKRIVDIQRQYKEIAYAAVEKPSVAAYGESQMGKSYLISAMLSPAGKSFCMSPDGETTYNFLNDINPSQEGAENEATGIVTRFSRRRASDPTIPANWLAIRLLSVADIVLILAEAWCSETVRPTEDVKDYFTSVEKLTKDIQLLSSPIKPLISEIDLAYIEKYLSDANSSSNFANILSSGLFNYLRRFAPRISKDDTMNLLHMVWNNNPDFNRLFDDLVRYRLQLGESDKCLVEFKSVLRRLGTLLDVERLNEMYNKSASSSSEYIGTVKVRGEECGEMIVSKPFLSALISELVVDVDSAGLIENRPFLDYFDILDFPGLKSSQEIKMENLGVGDNLATVFRRGKVTYLFAKYSATRRISSLLFCQNHNDYKAGKMGAVLERWVNVNIGSKPEIRAAVKNDLGGSPLLVISTWFNKNLEYSSQNSEDDLNDRWFRRFVRVLSNQVVKSQDLPSHWFNSWDAEGAPFKDIFLLRDFKYSRTIFKTDKLGLSVAEDACDAEFLVRLKQSFLNNDFVRTRFGDSRALSQWESSATPGNDGTGPIIEYLSSLAPRAEQSRSSKFNRLIGDLRKSLDDLIQSEYHDDDPAEQTKTAKRTAGRIVLAIDSRQGRMPWFFSRLLSRLAMPERLVRESVFNNISGAELTPPPSGPESEIIMAAGISSDDSRERKIELLTAYLGTDDETESSNVLKEMGVDINLILSRNQMVRSNHEELCLKLEKLWLTDYLGGEVASEMRATFPEIDSVVGTISRLWDALQCHKKLCSEVGDMMKRIVPSRQVGIIANWVAMQMTRFTCEFGYSWIDGGTMEAVKQKNENFKLGIDFAMSSENVPNYGVPLLVKIDDVKTKLTGSSFTGDIRRIQSELPEYNKRWQWQNRVRIACAILSGLRDYDIEANSQLNEMKKMLQ